VTTCRQKVGLQQTRRLPTFAAPLFFDAQKSSKKGSRQLLPLLPTKLCAGSSATVLPG